MHFVKHWIQIKEETKTKITDIQGILKSIVKFKYRPILDDFVEFLSISLGMIVILWLCKKNVLMKCTLKYLREKFHNICIFFNSTALLICTNTKRDRKRKAAKC